MDASTTRRREVRLAHMKNEKARTRASERAHVEIIPAKYQIAPTSLRTVATLHLLNCWMLPIARESRFSRGTHSVRVSATAVQFDAAMPRCVPRSAAVKRAMRERNEAARPRQVPLTVLRVPLDRAIRRNRERERGYNVAALQQRLHRGDIWSTCLAEHTRDPRAFVGANRARMITISLSLSLSLERHGRRHYRRRASEHTSCNLLADLTAETKGDPAPEEESRDNLTLFATRTA